MKRPFFSYLILGFVSIVSQVLFQRELISSFYGNEFFIGIILAGWFVWIALGSGLLGRYFNNPRPFIFLAGLILFLEIFLIRLLKNYTGFPGEVPNLAYGMLAAILAPAPVCLLLGIWWTSSTKETKDKLSNAYLIETIGFILGGIFFSLILVFLQDFFTAIIVIILTFIVSLKNRILLAFLVIFFTSLIFLPYLDRLDRISASYNYKGQRLLETKNTLYGSIAVTKIGTQYNFYENGVLLGTTEKTQFTEDIAHLPLLIHPSPKTVLVIGGGATGVLNEILKHPVEKLYYLELDPDLIGIIKQYLAKRNKEGLDDPRVEIVYADGRYFLNKTDKKFDVIIINLPPPSTALINRFYTKDFYETAKERLAPSGIFVNYLPYTTSAPSRTLSDLNSSIYKTLGSVFKKTLVLPEDRTLFISSSGENITYNGKVLIDRFVERKIKTDFILPDYIGYRLTTDRIEKLLTLFQNNESAKINLDFLPIAYFYQNLFWLDHFYPRFASFAESFVKYAWILFLFPLLFFIFYRHKSAPLFSMGTAGFSLMTVEMVVIFIYQVAIGYLYYRIAILISALVAGMALGIIYGKKCRSLYKLHLAMALFCSASPFILKFMMAEPLILICAVTAGFLGAAVFPVANRYYRSDNTGTVYSFDLIGSCLGALFPSLISIPLLGITQTILLAGVANWIMTVLLLFPKYLRRECV